MTEQEVQQFLARLNEARAAAGTAPSVAPNILDVGFKYENGVHTPTVLVGFAPNDWDARDAFVRSLGVKEGGNA